MFSFAVKPLEHYASYVYFENEFSEEECGKIHRMFPDEFQSGTIGNGVVNESIRKSKIGWINHSPDADWLYQKLTKTILKCNEGRWNFQLSGMHENLQLTQYEEGDHYDWHLDNGPGPLSKRKLSFVLQLSHPGNYVGSDLELIDSRGHPPVRGLGTLIIFPSYVAHRVTTLERGMRRSLVGWITGEPYR